MELLQSCAKPSIFQNNSTHEGLQPIYSQDLLWSDKSRTLQDYMNAAKGQMAGRDLIGQ